MKEVRAGRGSYSGHHDGGGRPLTAQVKLGEKVLLVGDSGTGKSALVRALAGVCPWSRGEVAHPHSAEICVLPQRAGFSPS